jgi:hypothetical protein
MSSAADFLPIPSLQALGHITQSLDVVEHLRQERKGDAQLARHTRLLKRWQSQRFQKTYTDVLIDPHMGAAARFFLTELYGEQEFAQRDAQFARIAGTLERLFPRTVIDTATMLAQLHALSETLDAYMARSWIARAQTTPPQEIAASVSDPELSLELYRHLWQSLQKVPGYNSARLAQIQTTQQLGEQLLRHTRIPGLRLMLKMMRAPAAAAGLQQLQHFLENGFDTFAQLSQYNKASTFLNAIAQRETEWLDNMNTPG